MSDLGAPVLELLDPKRGERILDIGCGDGVLTAKLAERGCDVVGIDSSPEQIQVAAKHGFPAHVADCQDLSFHGEFDAVFSNAAMHWMRRPDDVISGVWNALKPGGRFVAEFGGYGCVKTIQTALIEALDRRGMDGRAANPWYFPTVEDYSARLTKAGFQINSIALIPRPTPLPGDVTGWLQTFAESFTTELDPAKRAAYIAEVREVLQPKLCDAAGQWTADYVRLRFAGVKPLAPNTEC